MGRKEFSSESIEKIVAAARELAAQLEAALNRERSDLDPVFVARVEGGLWSFNGWVSKLKEMLGRKDG